MWKRSRGRSFLGFNIRFRYWSPPDDYGSTVNLCSPYWYDMCEVWRIRFQEGLKFVNGQQNAPPRWSEWREHRLTSVWRSYLILEWAMEWIAYWFEGLAFFKLLEYAGKLTVLVVVVTWFMESDQRQIDRQLRAWELINSAAGSSGDGGRRIALEELYQYGMSLATAPLAHAYLARVRLAGAELMWADFTEAILDDADLSGASLFEAKFDGARLSQADLHNANLLQATLTSAFLRHVNFGNSGMGGADMSGSDLEDAYLVDATLNGANLSDTDLEDTNFSQSQMHGVDLSRAEFSDTLLIGAQLPKANLTDASILGADFNGADLTGAVFRGAKLVGVNLLGATLTDAEMEGAQFCDTIMPNGSINNDDCKALNL